MIKLFAFMRRQAMTGDSSAGAWRDVLYLLQNPRGRAKPVKHLTGHSFRVQSLARIRSLMKRILVLFAFTALTAAPVALAQQGGNPWANQFSPGQAREAVREGKTVPLSKVFNQLKREYGGYQLGAELYSRDDGTTFYEIDWMTEDGRKAKFTVDAQSGSVINRRGG